MTSDLDSTNLRTVALFWWIAVGSFLSGLSLLSLVVSLKGVGLSGLIAIVHGQYVAVRNVLFDALERMSLLPSLSPDERSVLTMALVLFAVGTRTYLLVSRQSSAVRESAFLNVVSGAILALLLLNFLVGATLIPLLDPVLAPPQRIAMAAVTGFAALFLLFLLGAFPSVRLAALVYAVNLIACAVVAGLLLALNGAQ